MTFWLGYDLGFSAGVGFCAGIFAVVLAALYVAYRASNAWERGK